MINKTNLWFLTLSSIILVLAIYYIAIPNETINSVFSSVNEPSSMVESVKESEVLTAMRVSKEEKRLNEIQTLQEVLLNNSSTLDEKNEAYEHIQLLNTQQAKEEKLEKLINKEYNVSSFIEIKDATIQVVIANKKDSYTLANDIITRINKEVGSDYYVTVKFE